MTWTLRGASTVVSKDETFGAYPALTGSPPVAVVPLNGTAFVTLRSASYNSADGSDGLLGVQLWTLAGDVPTMQSGLVIATAFDHSLPGGDYPGTHIIAAAPIGDNRVLIFYNCARNTAMPLANVRTYAVVVQLSGTGTAVFAGTPKLLLTPTTGTTGTYYPEIQGANSSTDYHQLQDYGAVAQADTDSALISMWMELVQADGAGGNIFTHFLGCTRLEIDPLTLAITLSNWGVLHGVAYTNPFARPLDFFRQTWAGAAVTGAGFTGRSVGLMTRLPDYNPDRWHLYWVETGSVGSVPTAGISMLLGATNGWEYARAIALSNTDLMVAYYDYNVPGVTWWIVTTSGITSTGTVTLNGNSGSLGFDDGAWRTQSNLYYPTLDGGLFVIDQSPSEPGITGPGDHAVRSVTNGAFDPVDYGVFTAPLAAQAVYDSPYNVLPDGTGVWVQWNYSAGINVLLYSQASPTVVPPVPLLVHGQRQVFR